MHKQTWAIILAAGQGKRLKVLPDAPAKQFINYRGMPLFWHSASTLASVSRLDGIVFVLPPESLADSTALVRSLDSANPLGLPCKCVAGGPERQDSVWTGLVALPPECAYVLVHDSARPFMTAGLVAALLKELEKGHPGVIPGLEPTDTIKEVDAAGVVQNTPARSSLRLVQTPQAFDRSVLEHAHKAGRGLMVTDDAALLEALGLPVLVIPGEAANLKITRPEDLHMLQDNKCIRQWDMLPCTGMGYDVHKYGGNRPLRLGGILIESSDITVQAHSDGDVLLHALMDALLGCASAGDIGKLFPDSDPRFDGVSSALLLSEVLELVREQGIVLTHVDLTIVAQAPKVSPYRAEISKSIAKLLHLDENKVNLKATTEEGLGFTGAKQGIKAMAVVTALRPA